MSDLVETLILKLEKNPEMTRVSLPVLETEFTSAEEFRATQERLRQLCAVGALRAKRGRKGFKNRIESVTVADADRLYEAVGKIPRRAQACEAVGVLRAAANEWETPVIDDIEKSWARHGKWLGLSMADVERLVAARNCAVALRHDDHGVTDIRTFSTRYAGDSKFAENHKKQIMGYAYHGIDRPAESLEGVLGLSGPGKISMPLLVSGPYSYRGLALGHTVDYCGIPVHDTDMFELTSPPEYILTIENLVSFHRHAVEVNADRRGLVMYTSGQPSRAFKTLYARIVADVPSVPFFHWSDIDGGGLEISKTIMDINPSVRPHLMTLELVRTRGEKPADPVENPERFSNSWMEPLARYLSVQGNMTLEQETLDPVSPTV